MTPLRSHRSPGPIRALLVFAAILLVNELPARASAQGSDVRIDVKSGAIARLPLRCESLQGPGSGTASARDADAVLANDLNTSAVFDVDMSSKAAIQRRGEVVADLILAWVARPAKHG